MPLAAAGVAIGVLIGSTGVGGVLLVPFLIYALGFPVQGAVAVALWSYLWSGLLAIGLCGRRGSIPGRAAAWLCGAAVPAAFLGARALGIVPSVVVQGLIAAVLLVGACTRSGRRGPRGRSICSAAERWWRWARSPDSPPRSSALGGRSSWCRSWWHSASRCSWRWGSGRRSRCRSPRWPRWPTSLPGGWTGPPLAHGLSQRALRSFVAVAMIGSGMVTVWRVMR